jgi:predicted PurR-regulated permease PerM
MSSNLYQAFISNSGLRGLFSVIAVATVLTVYELGMFFYVVAPKVKEQVDEGIDEISTVASDIIKQSINQNTTTQVDKNTNALISYSMIPFRDGIDTSLETLRDREVILTEKINNYTRLTGVFLLAVLFVIMYVIKLVLNGRGETIGSCTWKIVLTTVVLIMSFQYSFYWYGQEYSYLGRQGNEELLYYLSQKL